MRTKLYEKPVAVAMASRRPARRGVQGRAGTVLLENVYARPGSPCATWTSTIVRRYGVKLMTFTYMYHNYGSIENECSFSMYLYWVTLPLFAINESSLINA